jgi:iron complex outermembrane receptor protein
VRLRYITSTLRLTLLLVFFCSMILAQEREEPAHLSQLSLEDLTNVIVNSVARKNQELFDTPAAVFVISHDDIRRSGATSLPELLRTVPGMQVAQIYANEWAVSSRGFNSRFADKMLVLIDGRSIYSEVYSGVYWDQNDLLLEDIDRIEVIRGPGGTLWGANAVNGIINVITLDARHSQGTLFVEDVDRLGTVAAARYGGAFGNSFRYRAYAKFARRNNLVTETGASARDAGSSGRFGVRADWQIGSIDNFSFLGDIYRGRETERIDEGDMSDISSSKVETSGGYVLGRWEHNLANYDMTLQSYYNQEGHVELSGGVHESKIDLDFVTHLPRYKRNSPSLGAGYRITADRIMSFPQLFGHTHHQDTLFSLFFEDEVSFVPSKLTATGGLKLIHNSYTGLEVQPGIRGIWKPNERRVVWVAASRAVRTPSIFELDLHYLNPIKDIGGVPADVILEGSPAFRSEVVYAYEMGYRQHMNHNFSIDVTGFFNKYRRLRSQSQLDPYVVTSPSVEVLIPLVYTNSQRARTNGIEAAVYWTPSHSLQVAASYAWLNAHRWIEGIAERTSGDSWATPTNTLDLRGTWEFTPHWSFYSSLYTVTKLPLVSSGRIPIAAYARADFHLSLEVSKSFQLSAGAENMQSPRHAEFDPSSDGYSVGSQIPRSFFAKALWSF